jgi:hypothetical protein
MGDACVASPIRQDEIDLPARKDGGTGDFCKYISESLDFLCGACIIVYRSKIVKVSRKHSSFPYWTIHRIADCKA